MAVTDRQQPGNIRLDHLRRYQYAIPICKGPVLDAACGIGYGSRMISDAGHEVTAIDIDREAIRQAHEHYNDNHAVRWLCGDVMGALWRPMVFRTVICLEALEHFPDPVGALKLFRGSLVKGDGRLICSVPNEEVVPFNAAQYAGDDYPHLKHYTPIGFETTLNDGGWEVIKRSCQMDKHGPVQAGSSGRTLVYLCMPR